MRRRLLRHGESVPVPPKALDVLEILLENRGRTVDKDDLMNRVWPDTIVEEANLTQSVFVLRRALGDEPSAPRYVATVARRGYRFVGEATEAGAAPSAEARNRAHGTSNLEAYHAYIKGRHYWSKRDADGLRAATGYFRQAIDLDPTYARAYVGLAECFVILRTLGWPTASDAFVMAKAAAARALDIDETIAEAHATLGVVRMCAERDWLGAGESFREAIALAPDYATTRNWYANYLAATGRLDEAIREAQHAVALDPLNVTWRMGVGNMLFLARRYDEAIESELAALEMEPDFALAHWILGMAFEQVGDLPRATVALRHADECSGGSVVIRGLLGRILALSGAIDEARSLLLQLAAHDQPGTTTDEAVAWIHAGLGETGQAIASLTRAARDGSFLLSFVNVSPLFDSLRTHQDFESLRSIVGSAADGDQVRRWPPGTGSSTMYPMSGASRPHPPRT